MKSIDLVVPCYNEEEGLEHFVLETNKVIATIPDYRFRYILVNDGSKDRTYLIMKQLAARFDNIKYISFSRNSSVRARAFSEGCSQSCSSAFQTASPTSRTPTARWTTA